MLGRLLNEYLVDMFSSVEDSRLQYIRGELQTRIAARHELDETIEAEGGRCAGRVYLPASLEGMDECRLQHGSLPKHYRPFMCSRSHVRMMDNGRYLRGLFVPL